MSGSICAVRVPVQDPSALRPLAEQVVNLPHAFGQRRRSRLQDVRRLDLVDVPAARRPACRASLAARRSVAFRTFLPHHDARITPARLPRRRPARRCGPWPSAAPRRCGNTGVPPAISTSSSTQRMPEISGSSHSSKNTRGRRRSRAADARIASRPTFKVVGQRLGAVAPARPGRRACGSSAGSRRRCAG